MEQAKTHKELDAKRGPGPDESEDKPTWKCPTSGSGCGWIGDAPFKSTKGILVGKFICPKCHLAVVKNE